MATSLVEHLIDSSVMIPYLRKQALITARLDALPNKFISPTVLAEVTYGAFRSRNPVRSLADIDAITALVPTVQIGRDNAYSFAETISALATTNRLIPDRRSPPHATPFQRQW